MQKNKLIAGFLLMFSATAGVAFAENGRFTSAAATGQGDNIIVTFKETGLGNTPSVTVQASANSTAVYTCINKKPGQNPADANQHSVKSVVTASGNFSADKSRSASGSLVLSPPLPNFSCPSGQSPMLQSATYTNVKVTDLSNKTSRNASDTF